MIALLVFIVLLLFICVVIQHVFISHQHERINRLFEILEESSAVNQVLIDIGSSSYSNGPPNP